MTQDRRSRAAEVFRTLRLTGAIALVAVCIVAIGMLTLDVKDRLNALEQANSDNTQWVLMQSEVEVLRLQGAILSALGSPPPDDMPASLDEVRRWFNVLYSRVSMLEQSSVYAPLLGKADYQDDHLVLRHFLDENVDLIDSSDDKLLAALHDLSLRLPPVRNAARQLTLKALTDFAAVSDAQRESMSDTLVRLAIMTAALFLLLAGTVIVLSRLYKVSETRAGELRNTGARLATIISNSADGIVVTDKSGAILEFNPAAQSIFLRRRDEVVGGSGLDLLFADGAQGRQGRALAEAMASMTDAREPLRMEIDALRGDGTTFPAEISIALSRPAGGNLVVSFVRDISDRRKAQRDLTDALDRALAGEKAKAEFLAVMSHEMRTPLNGLIGSMDLLGQSGLNDKQRELLSVMETSGDILLGHVNSVLDISKAEAGAIQIVEDRFDLDRLIEETVSNQTGLAASHGTRISVTRLSGPSGMVMGDSGRIRQILLNLVGNAVKFTKDGSITIETEVLADRDPKTGRNIYEFRVIDTGIGISEANLSRIFEDFVTVDASYGRSQGGTGLGLGIARRLAQAMGGNIGAESEEGEGSIFWLRLPLGQPLEDAVAEPARGPRLRGDAETPQGKPLNVLVVEDNEINRFLLRRYLEAAGHTVTEAVDGMNGVEVAQGAAFDAILMDISMPRMDGVEATTRIRASSGPSARARILALTAHALPEEQQRFRSVGMETGLTKPVDRVALLRSLAGTGTEAGAGDAAPSASDVLNLENLNELVEQIGQEMAATLIQRLVEEGEGMVGRIVTLVDPLHDGEVARIAHQLAGTCGTFGTTQLRYVLSGIEQAIKQGDPDALHRHRATLAAIWKATRAALEAQVEVLESVA